jgi:hypothetical protein
MMYILGVLFWGKTCDISKENLKFPGGRLARKSIKSLKLMKLNAKRV